MAAYPFCTIDPNIGVVSVPDQRLEVLAGFIKPQKVTPAAIRFVDIAGLVRGASRGEGLGNRFLGNIREVDAIVHIVRLFQEPQVAHIEGKIDPVQDAQTVETELCLADLETVGRRLERIEKPARLGQQDYRREVAELHSIREELDTGVPARLQKLSLYGQKLAKELQLLSARPVLYVGNIAEAEIQSAEKNTQLREFQFFAQGQQAPVVVLAVAFEAELAELDPIDQQAFLEDAGLREPSLNQLIRASYALLGYITFFTVQLPELRAWNVPEGTTALAAAAEIHTDFVRGFICAEVLSYSELLSSGGYQQARDRGLVRQEGRDYQVQDGDIIYFRFNVTS